MRLFCGLVLPILQNILPEKKEKPGELLTFLNAIGSIWNISLFHYRNHGADFGRVLIGLQIEEVQVSKLLKHLNSLNYEFFEETYNDAYKLFLR